jgi:hypothetical protein
MDWARAIEINRVALTRIVGELFALLGLVSGSTFERMLRPAESALRQKDKGDASHRVRQRGRFPLFRVRQRGRFP